MNTVADLKNAPPEQEIPFEGVFVLKKAQIKRAKNDSEFLAVELGDKTGSLNTVLFQNHAKFSFLVNCEEGCVLKVQGQTGYYQGRFSPSVTDAVVVPEAELGPYLEQLVESAPIPLEELWAEFNDHLASIQDEALRETVGKAIEELEEAFKTSPAAISMHHAYRSGLIEHTVRMARVCRATVALYPEVDPDLAMAGILLHDLGKVLEYGQELGTKKTTLGQLQGHVVLGYRQVRRAGIMAKLPEDRLEQLEHIILSHQGELEWGAAVKAATAEAVYVSMVDNLDAKMGMVQHALRTTGENQTFSDFLPGLGSPVLRK